MAVVTAWPEERCIVPREAVDFRTKETSLAFATYSTVTLFARLRGLSTSRPSSTAR